MKLNALFEEKLPKECIIVPYVKQKEEYSCGAAVALSVLRYFGVDGDCKEEDLFKSLKTGKDGTDRKNIVKLLEDCGLEVELKSGTSVKELKDWISSTKLALVCIQAWEDEDDPVPLKRSMNNGHYCVCIGFDDERAYFMDPYADQGNFGFIKLDDFEKRWHDVGDDNKRQDHQTIFISGSKPKKIEDKRPNVIEIE